MMTWVAGLMITALFGTFPCQGVIDANTNGMSDVWEAVYSATNLDPLGDPDMDGQNNLQESVAGTDPFSNLSVFRLSAGPLLENAHLLRFPSVRGKTYIVEAVSSVNSTQWVAQPTIFHGTGDDVLAAVPAGDPPWANFRVKPAVIPTAVQAAMPYLGELDTDQDGVPDIMEFLDGTNPFDAGSLLSITSNHVGRALLVSWGSVTGKTYQVQVSSAPTGPWKDLGFASLGSGSTMIAAIEADATSAFVRVNVSDEDSDSDGVSEWELGMAGVPSLRDARPDPVALPPLQAIPAMLRATNVVELDSGLAVADVTRGGQGSFVVTRRGNLNPITVHYVVSGTAVAGVHYEPLSGSVVLAAGARGVEVPIKPIAGNDFFPAKIVTVTLQPDPAYAMGTNLSVSVNLVSESVLSVKDFGAVAPLLAREGAQD